MTEFIKKFIDFIWDFYNVVNGKLAFDLFGFKVGILNLFLSFVILFMITSYFWKGAKG